LRRAVWVFLLPAWLGLSAALSGCAGLAASNTEMQLTRDQGRLRNFALFLDGKSVVDDRFAVQTDDCDLQTYYPFDRVPTGLNPLH